MVSFEEFKHIDGMPVYLQILYYIKRGVVAGNIIDGDELPSRRVLSALLGINPNTVQKAFKQLEEESLIESHSGAKSYMTLDEKKVNRLREDLLADDIKGIIHSLKQMAISKDEAMDLLEKHWDED